MSASEVWLIVDVPRMDCSDTVTAGPFKTFLEACEYLRDESTQLARGSDGVNADVIVLVAERRNVQVYYDENKKRQLRET